MSAAIDTPGADSAPPKSRLPSGLAQNIRKARKPHYQRFAGAEDETEIPGEHLSADQSGDDSILGDDTPPPAKRPISSVAAYVDDELESPPPKVTAEPDSIFDAQDGMPAMKPDRRLTNEMDEE